MPRYFFDIGFDDRPRDDVGTSFVNLERAISAGEVALIEAALDATKADSTWAQIGLVIRDDQSHPVYASTLMRCGRKIFRDASLRAVV